MRQGFSLQTRHLTKMFGDFLAVDEINLHLEPGESYGFLGPNGAGKTTTLMMIAGFETPTSGDVFVGDTNITNLPVHKRNIGVVFQSYALFPHLSVFENVAFPLRVHTDLPEDMIRDIVLMKLEAVGLRGAVELMPDELSGGMKRRVALARAIALDPQILLYDEPFAGQDPIAMGVLVRLIRLLNDSLGITSIIVSHDLAETASIADYIYVVGDGQVLGQGTPAQLREADDPRIRQFMKGIADGPVPFHYPAPDLRRDLLGGL